MANVYDAAGNPVWVVGAEPKPTLASLQGLVDRIVRMEDAMTAHMSGRDDREAGATEPERQAKDKAETEAHDREEAQARAIVTLDDARRRIADLEDELEILAAQASDFKDENGRLCGFVHTERNNCRAAHDELVAAHKRIADLEHERNIYRKRLTDIAESYGYAQGHINEMLKHHQENQNE